MRQKDIAIIAVVVIFGGVFSALISKALFAKPANRKVQVEVVQPITGDFEAPDKRFFNQSSIDPTLPIQIGNNSNPDPFREIKK